MSRYRSSFEEACKIQHEYITAERLLAKGEQQTYGEAEKFLTKVGWTLGELYAEAYRRQEARLKRGEFVWIPEEDILTEKAVRILQLHEQLHEQLFRQHKGLN
jgi:ATP-dependent Clp protease ATP-binding subunit ClpA